MKKAFSLLVLSFVLGCAPTVQELQHVAGSRIGCHIDRGIAVEGAPTQVVSLFNGNKLYVWCRDYEETVEIYGFSETKVKKRCFEFTVDSQGIIIDALYRETNY